MLLAICCSFALPMFSRNKREHGVSSAAYHEQLNMTTIINKSETIPAEIQLEHRSEKNHEKFHFLLVIALSHVHF